MSILVAVPVKDLANAKQRLVAFLSHSERGDLARGAFGVGGVGVGHRLHDDR